MPSESVATKCKYFPINNADVDVTTSLSGFMHDSCMFCCVLTSYSNRVVKSCDQRIQ